MTIAIPKEYAYLKHVSLASAVGDNASVRVVMAPSGHDKDEIALALSVVEQMICPFPARWIKTWFWETPAGKSVAAAQWILYGDEAVSLQRAMRMIWGKRRYERVEWRVRHSDWKIFAYPPSQRHGKGDVRYYMRYSDVLRYIEDEKKLENTRTSA